LHEEEESEAPEEEDDADQDDLFEVHQLAERVLMGQSAKIHTSVQMRHTVSKSAMDKKIHKEAILLYIY
jgi:hypothetical protein